MLIIMLSVFVLAFIGYSIWWVVSTGCNFRLSILPLCTLICILLVFVLSFLLSGPNISNQVRLNVNTTYERLTNALETEEIIDATLLQEIYEYNAIVETGRKQQDSFYYWGAVPKVYYEFSLIDTSIIEHSILEIDKLVT